MASLGEIEFHGYHTAMEEVTLVNDGNTFQVRDVLFLKKKYGFFFVNCTALECKILEFIVNY